MKNLIALLFSVTILSACVTSVSTPGLEVETEGGTKIKIEDGTNSNSKFCPPGQAKKGAC